MIDKNKGNGKLGIYIHVPYCQQKCLYCGFYSQEGQLTDDREKRYLQEMKEDIACYGREYGGYTVDTIFIGGGTPSVLKTDTVESILRELEKNFNFNEDMEISIETNPGTVDMEKLRRYRSMGINRLSMGCQSFDDEILKRLGRIHRTEDIKESFMAARQVGFDNINLDLMFAVPGHNMEIWEDSLRETMELQPEHISFYSLQIEEGTPFYEMYRRGQLPQISDELDRKMYHRAIQVFKDHGYEHYEISNCAKPGRQCRHNMKYWNMDPYIGIGPSASSYIEGARFTEGPYPEFHENTDFDNGSEFMFTGLRKSRGIRFDDFKEVVGCSWKEMFADREEELKPFIQGGQLQVTSEGMRLTESGIDISNKIMAIFV